MKILLACETYSPDINGASVFARRLAHGLAVRGHIVHVVCPSPTRFSYREDDRGVTLHRLSTFRYPWHSTFRIVNPKSVSSEIYTVIDRIQPDIVHAQAHFIVGRSACAQARQNNIRLIATNHFMPDNLRGYFPVRVPNQLFRLAASLSWRDLHRVFSQADVVTAPTAYACEMLSDRAGIRGAEPISCGIDLNKYAPGETSSTPGDVPTILYVGRLDPDKCVGDLLSALALLKSDFRARIVGNGVLEKSLRRKVAHLKLHHAVDIQSGMSNSEIRMEYKSADIFCMPGSAELQSISTLEAMASGLPIVAANAHALPMLVKPGSNGELFAPGNVKDLAMSLDRVILDREQRQSYGKQSRKIASNHSIISTIDKFEELYLDIRQ